MTANTRHAPLTGFALLVAASAFAGAAGLVTGGLDTGAAVDHRLPFRSPVFGGVALALIVGVPTALVAWAAWRGSPRVGTASVAAGVLLVGWIAVEIAYIREISWLQPVYAGIGAGFVAMGRAIDRRHRSRAPDASPRPQAVSGRGPLPR